METPPDTKELRPYQSRVYLDLAKGMRERRGETFTVLFPRQAGKNEVAAALTVYLLATHSGGGGSVVICAPTMTPQAEISLARVRERLRRVGREGLIQPLSPAAEGHVLQVGNAAAVFLSGSPEAHVAGHTASLALIADEAQEIDAEWFDRQFRPMVASTAAPIVLFGTPWDGDTLLDRAVAANRERDARETAENMPRLHFQVGWREVAEVVPDYGRYVRAERRRLGATHPLFRTQYALETVVDAGRLLAPDDLAAIEGGHPRLREPLAGERYAGGLDFAGEGERADATVLTIARIAAGGRCEVVEHVAWQSRPFGEVEHAALSAARRWRLERLCVDASGLGGPLAARFEAELGGHVVERFTFTAQSKPELGYALLAAARTGRLALYAPDGSAEPATARHELAVCRARFDGPGRLRWEAPAGAHDDYVASLALCLRATAGAGEPRTAIGRRGAA